MTITNFTHGISSFGVPVFGSGMPTQGNVYFVKPVNGLDSNDGSTPEKALKTLARAQVLATANQNDIVFFMAEGESSSACTDYQSSVLTWAKDHVHLIGVNAGGFFSQRSRVAFASTYDTATTLFVVSADSCLIANVSFYMGVAGTTPTGCVKVTGHRNVFKNCHIAGIGNDANDINGASSLWLYDAVENVFDDCTIGLDTISRGTATVAEILFTTAAGVGSARTVFRNCRIIGMCGSAGNYRFVMANAANALDRFLLFDNCVFMNTNAVVNGGAQMTQAFTFHADVNANVILHLCTIVGADNVNASDTGHVYCGAGALSAVTEATDLGLAVVTTNA